MVLCKMRKGLKFWLLFELTFFLMDFLTVYPRNVTLWENVLSFLFAVRDLNDYLVVCKKLNDFVEFTAFRAIAKF